VSLAGTRAAVSCLDARDTQKLSPFTAGYLPPLRRHDLPMSCREEGKKVTNLQPPILSCNCNFSFNILEVVTQGKRGTAKGMKKHQL
jgi:hypothetical protein